MSSTAPDAAIALALLQRRQPGTTPASVVKHILVVDLTGRSGMRTRS